MFSNLTKEIICYAVIPTIVVTLIGLILFFIAKGKEIKGFKINYIVKITLMIAIGFMLALIAGYTAWVIKCFWAKDLFFENIPYIALIIFLSLCLLVLIIWIFLKLLKDLNNYTIDIKKLVNE